MKIYFGKLKLLITEMPLFCFEIHYSVTIAMNLTAASVVFSYERKHENYGDFSKF